MLFGSLAQAGKAAHEGDQNGKKVKSTSREYLEALLWALLLAVLIRGWGVQAFKIPSGSMIPTLLVGDHLLVSKSSYDFVILDNEFHIPFGTGEESFLKMPWPAVSIQLSDPERGDIIVFRFPEDRSTDFIKRIIALPGETVEVRGRDIFIDGRQIQDDWGQHAGGLPDPGCPKQYRFGPIKVPEGQYFVMGDNRDNSRDGRCWFGGQGGFVPRKDILGRAFIIYWSWENYGWNVRWDRIGKLIR